MSNYPDGCNGPEEHTWSWNNEHDVEEWDDEANAIVMKNLPNASEELQQEYKESCYDAGPEDGEGIAEEELEKHWMHYKLTPLMKESIGFGK